MPHFSAEQPPETEYIQVHLNKFVEKFIYFSNSTQIVKLVFYKFNTHRLK